MEEKVVIKGKFTKNNFLALACLVLAVICFVISVSIFNPGPDEDFEDYFWTVIGFECPEGVAVFCYLGILFVITALVLFIMMNACEITVTDKRVYGKTSFGRMVDLPMDKISSVGSCIPMGVKVATSSGMIVFWLLSNQSEVFNEISKLLQARQTTTAPAAPVTVTEPSSADELEKYKNLLDKGIITQEEFDAKKKQLLGL